METKLRRLSRITVPKGDRSPDSIVRSKAINMNDRARGQEILMEAQACYMSMHKFREERARNERYLNGDQWSDIIEIDEGGIKRRITEEKYLKEQGCVPLKTNLIRKKVDAVKGLFIGQQTEPRPDSLAANLDHIAQGVIQPCRLRRKLYFAEHPPYCGIYLLLYLHFTVSIAISANILYSLDTIAVKIARFDSGRVKNHRFFTPSVQVGGEACPPAGEVRFYAGDLAHAICIIIVPGAVMPGEVPP